MRSFPDEAMKIVYVEYDIPSKSRMPWSAVEAKDGSFWIPYYGAANRIGRLDAKTGKVVEYRVPIRERRPSIPPCRRRTAVSG